MPTPERRAARPGPELVEPVVELVRASALVREARLGPLVDGAILGAEQVQDIRLALIDHPEPPSGWSVFAETAMTVLVDTRLPGKLLGAVAGKVFGGLLAQNRVFLALPKSAVGRELVQAARREPARSSEILKLGTVDLPGLGSRAEVMTLYHASIQTIARTASGVDLAKATLKAAQGYKKGKVKPSAPRLTDSVGTTVLASAMDYAAGASLASKYAATRIEGYCRASATVEELGVLAGMADWDDLAELTEPGRAEVDLAELRRRYALFFEALIWARAYGFAKTGGGPSRGRPYPSVSTNDPKAPFVGSPAIRQELQQYWLSRFGPEANRYFQEARGRPPETAPVVVADRIQWYFAEMAEAVDRVGMTGALPRLDR